MNIPTILQLNRMIQYLLLAKYILQRGVLNFSFFERQRPCECLQKQAKNEQKSNRQKHDGTMLPYKPPTTSAPSAKPLRFIRPGAYGKRKEGISLKNHFYIILTLCFCLFSCTNEQKQETTIPIRPIKYATLGMSNEAQEQTFAGFAKAGVEAKLSFRASGQIERLNVKVGDNVQKGQLIARLDDRDASLSYQQAKASLENARVQKANAQSSLTRVRQLYQSNNISLAEYEQAKNQFASANASFKSAEKALDLQASQLTYFKLTAPVSGIVSMVNNEVNEVVQAGSPVVVLSAGKDIEIEVGIPEAYISQIKQDDPVHVRFASINNQVFDAKVTEISFAVDATRNTYPVTVLLENPSKEVRPGMTGEVHFSFSSGNASQLVLPVNALADGPDGNFIFVIENVADGKGTIKKQPLTIGKLLPGGFEIKEGVTAGTLVATAGLNSLLNGMEVKLMEK